MKQYWYILAALLVVGLVLLQRFAFDSVPRQREELSALPGGVAYSEGSSTVPELFQEARTFLEKQDVEQAEKIYRKIVATELSNAPGYVGLGSSRFWQEDYSGAAKQYQKALTLQPRSTQALLGLAGVASQDGRYEAAAEYYERALAVDVNLADAYWGLATSQLELKRNEQALRNYGRFLDLAPKSSLADKARKRIAALREQIKK